MSVPLADRIAAELVTLDAQEAGVATKALRLAEMIEGEHAIVWRKRGERAALLAAALTIVELDADAAEQMTDHGWELAASLAGLKSAPSTITRNIAIGMLQVAADADDDISPTVPPAPVGDEAAEAEQPSGNSAASPSSRPGAPSAVARRPGPSCTCKAGDGTNECPYEDQCYSEWLDRQATEPARAPIDPAMEQYYASPHSRPGDRSEDAAWAAVHEHERQRREAGR